MRIADLEERRRTFVHAWLRHGNVTRAMLESDVVSRASAYKFLNMYRAGGEAALEIHRQVREGSPRKRRLSDDVIQAVLQWREREPALGRRRIAARVNEVFDAQVVSPSSVQNILIEHHMWDAPLWRDDPPQTWLPHAVAAINIPRLIEIERLGVSAMEGVLHDVHNDTSAAYDALHHRFWTPIERDLTLLALLDDSEEWSGWAARGLIQHAHVLINRGFWYTAGRSLQLAERVIPAEISPRRSHPEADAAAYSSPSVQAGWSPASLDHPHASDHEFASLRRDDLRVELCQYVGVVARDSASGAAHSRLIEARRICHGKGRRVLIPVKAANYRAVIDHDLAKLRLLAHERGQFSSSTIEIQRLLDSSREALIATNNSGMLASTFVLQARLHAVSGQRELAHIKLPAIEQALGQALAVARTQTASSLTVNTIVSSTSLLLKHGLRSSVDTTLLRDAAILALHLGMTHQAVKITALPGIETLLDRHLLSDLSLAGNGSTDFVLADPRTPRRSLG